MLFGAMVRGDLLRHAPSSLRILLRGGDAAGRGVRDILGEGEITNVSVLPGFRGRGISRRLLRMLLREAGERGTRVFTLEVRAGNRPAIALYESLGFRTEGVRRGFYEKPAEDALIMWKR